MKTPKPLLLLLLLVCQIVSTAQVEWYQNQDANNPVPYGTVSTAVKSLNSGNFIACYLWSTNGDENTWKISKSNINGHEQRTFFITAISALVEFKVSNNSVYVFERSFTADFIPQYRVYKLDANLTLRAQRSIEFPDNFFIYNTNAFELDGSANVYFAGAGQYPVGWGGYLPASFVWKMDKNLNTKWKRLDSTQTSYTRLHIDGNGKVLVICDYYEFFPQVKIKKITSTGQNNGMVTVSTDPGRYSLYSALDHNDNLLLYGGKSIGDTAQAMYLYKISKQNGNIMYSKTHFTAASSQLNDLRLDDNGNVFSLVTQTFATGYQVCKISRINPANGNISWNRSIPFAQDSCNLTRLVMNESNKFFAVGEKRSCNYFSKGFAMRVKKDNGQLDGDFPAPDSVAFQRSHWLADGLIDHNDELIAIGNTTDLDTFSYSNTYFRAFAVKFGRNRCDNNRSAEENITVARRGAVGEEIADEDASVITKLVIYPNPVQDELKVTGINMEEYDRIVIFNIQGVQLKQQYVRGSTARIDITGFMDGVYLLVLRSSISGREKSLKFVVKK